ncbi:MAG: glycoside hydrolase family 127 protein, partial [Abditibacteriota bacterium]|nr:glycoside hydrolase family 127 protein [Abditibacteriota bacterium]
FGPEDGKMHGYPGHEEIELALVKLYKCTGREKYLELADYFLTARGTQPHYWDYEAEADAEFNKSYVNTPLNTYHYAQAHLPVREQREALGHAVRAGYLYCGMTDVGKLKGDKALLEASRAIWKDVTERKQYITGGVGSDPSTEGFSAEPYFLPNIKAYCEACASIAFIFWTQRLLNTEPKAVYADKIETTLYNALMAAMSEDGSRYFYVNPLESLGAHHRSGWFGCSCCPPNIARLYADIGEYIYSVDDKDIYVHQYIGSRARVGDTVISQETEYPFEETVRLTITGADARVWYRIPSWCQAPRVTVNGKEVSVKAGDNGYSCIEHSGETRVTLTFPMEPVFNTADKRIVNNRGALAVTCGPLVYCIEEADNGPLDHLTIVKGGASKTDRALFDKYPIVKAAGRDHSGREAADKALTLIPYFLWDNREPGAMKVWIPEIYREPDTLGKTVKTIAAADARKKGQWSDFDGWCTSVTPGSSIDFLLDGSGFEVHWLGYNDAGLLEVFVDGVSAGVIDEYWPEKHQARSQSFSGFGEGLHKVRLTVKEGKNPDSGGSYVNFVKVTAG